MEFANINFFTNQSTEPFKNNTCFPNSVVEAGKRKLIEHLRKQYTDIVEDQIILEECKEVIWPNGSLGCPQEDESYIEVLTPGYEIDFRFGNEHYKMHTDSLGLWIASPDFHT